MIPFILLGGGLYLVFDALSNERKSFDPLDYGLPTKGFRGYRRGAAHFAKGGMTPKYGFFGKGGMITKKEVVSTAKELKSVIEDKEDIQKELSSSGLSDFEKDMLEKKKADLSVKEDYLHGQLRFLLRRYAIGKGKPVKLNPSTYSFIMEKVFSDGGEVPQVGQRVELIQMYDDPKPVEPGTKGTVRHVGGDVINVDWDNGRSLGLVMGVDKFKMID